MRRSAIGGAGTVLLLLTGVALAQPATEPVPFSKLMPLLPDKVEGFVAEKAGGTTTSAVGFRLSEVSRVYHRGEEDADESVTVRITDGTGNEFFAAAHAGSAPFNHESAQGYAKGFTLDGYPAIEKYTNEDKAGALTVFVADCFLVEISINGLDSKLLQEWWKKIDAPKLTALKAS